MESGVRIQNAAAGEGVQVFGEGVEFHLHEGGVHAVAQGAERRNFGIAEGGAKTGGVRGELACEGFQHGAVFVSIVAEDRGEIIKGRHGAGRAGVGAEGGEELVGLHGL